MAKDVDLSSKEWRDIVFEGKNQEYGAYTLRAGSAGRHNKAMIVIIMMALIAALAVLVDTVIKQAEARPEDEGEQVLVEMTAPEEAEEAPEEEPQKFEEQELEQVVQEELLNTQKVTEILVADDDEVTEEIKSVDEQKEDDRAVGAVNEDRGVDDIINAQEHKEVVVVEEKVETKPEPEKVFDAVEQPPQFPGGDAALLKYIGDNLRYPQLAIENNIQGRVVVQFVVTKTGEIGQVKVVRGKDPDLDKEAVRVVKTIPRFQPGKQNGNAVNVWYTLPINFKLSSN